MYHIRVGLIPATQLLKAKSSEAMEESSLPSYIDLLDDLLLVGKTFKDVLEGKGNLLESCSCS